MSGRYVLYDRGTGIELARCNVLPAAIFVYNALVAEHGWHGYGRYLAVTDRGGDRN